MGSPLNKSNNGLLPDGIAFQRDGAEPVAEALASVTATGAREAKPSGESFRKPLADLSSPPPARAKGRESDQDESL